MRVADTKNLLQRNDVGIEFCKNFRYAFDGYSTVHSASFVNVVGHDAHVEILPRLKRLGFNGLKVPLVSD
jgi:hypothetical protein